MKPKRKEPRVTSPPPMPIRAKLAMLISNDIAEGIDCGESREMLRMTVSYYATEHNNAFMQLAQAKSQLQIFKLAFEAMKCAIEP